MWTEACSVTRGGYSFIVTSMSREFLESVKGRCGFSVSCVLRKILVSISLWCKEAYK